MSILGSTSGMATYDGKELKLAEHIHHLINKQSLSKPVERLLEHTDSDTYLFNNTNLILRKHA